MPRLRKSTAKVDSKYHSIVSDLDLSNEVLTNEEQQDVVEYLTIVNYAKNGFIINILSVLLLLPIPILLHLQIYRKQTVVTLLSILNLVSSVIRLKYSQFIISSNNQRYVVGWIVWDVVLSIGVISLVVDGFGLTDLIYLVPLIASITSTVVNHLIHQIDLEVDELNSLKYKSE